MWLDELGCSGSENSLDDCPHDGWGVHDCKHNEDVSIECQPPTTAPPVAGTLFIIIYLYETLLASNRFLKKNCGNQTAGAPGLANGK